MISLSLLSNLGISNHTKTVISSRKNVQTPARSKRRVYLWILRILGSRTRLVEVVRVIEYGLFDSLSDVSQVPHARRRGHVSRGDFCPSLTCSDLTRLSPYR